MEHLVPARIYIDEVVPDFQVGNQVYSWILKGRFPKSKIDLDIEVRNRIEVESLAGNLAECILRITKANFSLLENHSGIKCQFLGNHSALDFFPDLAQLRHNYPDHGMEYMDFEFEVGRVMENYSDDGFGMSFFEEADMIQTEDGVLLVTEGALKDQPLEKGQFYSVQIQHVVLNSAKILK